MNELHVSSDLSAYLDQELAPADQARVSAHLGTCERCSGQLADLRATATLMAALPAAKPSRSLVPSLAPRFNWLRPVRSFSSVTSGAFLFVFLVAAVAQSGSDLGGGPPVPFGGAPAAAPAAPSPAAGAAELQMATESPVPAAAPAAAGASPEPTAADAARSARETESTAFSRATGAAEDAAARVADGPETLREGQGLGAPPTPLIWLGLSLIAATVAAAAHWRLRSA